MSKDRVIDFGWNSLSRGIGLAITIGIIYAAMAIVAQVPCWLGSMWPSVVTGTATAVFRDKDQGAFILSNEKVAYGDPLDPEFHAQGQDGAFSPLLGLSVHRCRDDNARIDGPLPKHPVGSKWQTRLCFDMPGTISIGDQLTVTGHLVHHRWFGVIHEAAPRFTMCPVGRVVVKDADGERCRPG